MRSRDVLAGQGVGLPLENRYEHVSTMLKPLTSFEGDEVPPRVQRALAALAARLEQAKGSRLVLTLEDLAELDAVRAGLVVDALSVFEVHLVITARDWARQIPSEWQQSVKERLVTPYRDFARAIRDRAPEAAQFLARQDVPAIAARWGQALAPERVHVVAVPPSGSDPARLFELFAQVIDIDPATLEVAGGRNPSLGYEQAETLRRVNVALGDRLMDLRREYRWAVRQLIYRGALVKQSGVPLRLPPELAAWCQEATAMQAEQLTARGYDVVGSADHLVSMPAETAELVEVSDARVAEVAVAALADVACVRFRELKDAERDATARPAAAAAADPAPVRADDPSGPAVDRVRTAKPPPVRRLGAALRRAVGRGQTHA